VIRIYSEDVEWIFNQDVREKKRTGNGIHGRAARLRKKESVKMPSEQEPDKFQRRLILGAGPCFTTTLREMKFLELMEKVKSKQQITIDELKESPIQDGVQIYNELRKMYDIIELQKALDCSLDQILELSTVFNLDWMKRIQYGEWIKVPELSAAEYKEGQKIYAELRRLYTTTEILKGLDCAPAQISELSWHFKVARKGKQILVGEDALDVLRNFRDNRLNQAQAKRDSDESAATAGAAQAAAGSETTTSKRKYKAREKKEVPSIPPITPSNENTLAKKEEAVDKMEEIAPNQITLVEVKNPEIELLRISLKNIYNADQITSLFTRLQLFVEGQENNFELNLVLQERVPS
jgi:hypothetical protein